MLIQGQSFIDDQVRAGVRVRVRVRG